MLDDLDDEQMYRVRIKGSALMALARVLRMSIEDDNESVRKQSHADDARQYHAALAWQHDAMAAMLEAEEEDMCD